MKKTLSRLEKVELREVWGHEALDFTTWLAKKENLDALSEEIGIDIALEKTEAEVGRFSVDILAKEETSDRKVIIENQLEDTNHDHLGKIITYAAGHEAEIIIWIVKDARDEHRKAVEWLNEHTDEKTNFFLIKIELWRIEGSNPAPKFETIVGPNEWAKTIKTSQANERLTETKLQQLDFWERLRGHVAKKNIRIRLQTPRPQHWYDIRMGSSESHIVLTLNSRENLLGCEIYINRNKELFNFLKERKAEIEKEIGGNAEWIDARVASRILVQKEVEDIFSQADSEKHFEWLCERTVLFQNVFGRYFKEFKK